MIVIKHVNINNEMQNQSKEVKISFNYFFINICFFRLYNSTCNIFPSHVNKQETYGKMAISNKREL